MPAADGAKIFICRKERYTATKADRCWIFWNRICSAAEIRYIRKRRRRSCHVLRQKIRRRNCGRSSGGSGNLRGNRDWPIGTLPWSAEIRSVMHRMRSSWLRSMIFRSFWITIRNWNIIRLWSICAVPLRLQPGIFRMRA